MGANKIFKSSNGVKAISPHVVFSQRKRPRIERGPILRKLSRGLRHAFLSGHPPILRRRTKLALANRVVPLHRSSRLRICPINVACLIDVGPIYSSTKLKICQVPLSTFYYLYKIIITKTLTPR